MSCINSIAVKKRQYRKNSGVQGPQAISITYLMKMAFLLMFVNGFFCIHLVTQVTRNNR